MNDARIVLIEHASPRHRLVLAPDAAPATRHAAEELDRFLRQIGGAEGAASPSPTSARVFVGPSADLAEAMPELAEVELAEEEFMVRTSEQDLAILGGSPRGTLNGVYFLLERYFGCRWFTATISRIPRRDVVALPAIELREGPAFPMQRGVLYPESYEQDWAARNRVNLDWARLDEKHGGPPAWFFPPFHNYHHWVAPKKYFADHPEYFSSVDGRRREDAQLCLSSPEVLEITVQGIVEAAQSDPSLRYFGLIPMDWPGYCECGRCRELDEKEGGPGGTVMWFTNRVAEKVAARRPDIYIVNCSYSYYTNPPLSGRMHPRVIIMMAVPSLWQGCGVHPVETCETLQSFPKLVSTWKAKCDHLWVWYYCTVFTHYFMPLPNLYAIRDNLRFYRRQGVKGIDMQGAWTSRGGENAELRSYVCAKLLWNPDEDVDELIDEFLEGVCGKAAAPLKQYVRLMHGLVENPRTHVRNYASLDEGPLFTPAVVSKAEALFDEAERLAEMPEIRDRVKYLRLPLQYVKIKAELGMVNGLSARVSAETQEEVSKLILAHGIAQVREGGSIGILHNSLRIKGSFLTRWWALGPLPAIADEEKGALESPPPSFGLDRQFAGSDGQEARWRKRETTANLLDFNREKKGRPNKDVMYALARVWTPDEMTTELSLAFISRGFKVWLNGEPIYQWTDHRWAIIEPDQEVIPVSLKKGVNELLIMMFYSGGGWDAMVRFDDPKGALKNDY